MTLDLPSAAPGVWPDDPHWRTASRPSETFLATPTGDRPRPVSGLAHTWSRTPGRVGLAQSPRPCRRAPSEPSPAPVSRRPALDSCALRASPAACDRASGLMPSTIHQSAYGLRPSPARSAAAAAGPWRNMSGDPEQEYFADGMVEDIITGLSRIKWLFVIARNSSFAYKGKSIDIRQVSRELGVRYVLEGSVRKAGGRLRITAQLIDADNGAHVWADRYDGALDDVFEFQDRITETIVGIIEPNVRRTEIQRARRKRPDSLDAYDLCLQAAPHFASGMPEDTEIAIPLVERALKIDPH